MLMGGLEGPDPPAGSRGRALVGVWGQSPRRVVRGALGIVAEIPQAAE